jgi:hypothetical protein
MSNAEAFREMLLDFERAHQQRLKAAISKDPAAHRDTTLMGEDGLRWRYWRVPTSKSSYVAFCYATTKNAAGYYLTWQETVNSKGVGTREFIRGHKLRRDAKESAMKSRDRFMADHDKG